MTGGSGRRARRSRWTVWRMLSTRDFTHFRKPLNGCVSFTLKDKQTGIYVSSVTTVTQPSYTYDPGDNVETDESLVVP